MKKFKLFSVLLAVLMIFQTAACASESKQNQQQGNQNEKETETVVLKDINANPLSERLNVNLALAGTDALGREISPVSGEGNGRLVGLFYTLWLGNYYSDAGQSYFPNEIYDMSKMDFTYLYSGSGSPYTKMHFWGEPLFGYYNQQDVWVVDNHVKMFIAAGIDFLGIDATNNDFYPEPLEVLLSVLDYYHNAGYKVPKIMFLTNTDSADRVTEIYEHLYKNQRYKYLWFCDDDGGSNTDAKPWITMKQGDKVNLRMEVLKAFYFRESQWPNESFKENGFPWIEFTRPQPVHNGIISVSVAQNNGMHMSNSVQFENSPNGNDYYNSNWGRGYSSTDGVNDKTRVNEGSNFQEQWEVAIASDARIAFVLEWNEWAALKLNATVTGFTEKKVVFFDCASTEFSRDIEPMKGGYGDSFYMQLINNIRRFKGQVGGTGIAVDVAQIAEGSVNWNAVSSGVADFTGVKSRNYANCNDTETYVNDTVRNDIAEIRLAKDDSYVYVLIACDGNVVCGEDRNWMNLWIKTGENRADCGYTFAVGLSRADGKADVSDLVNNKSVGKASYRVSGKFVEYAVPKAIFGQSFELKVTDNVDLTEDIMNLYSIGDCAPYGRLNYKFGL